MKITGAIFDFDGTLFSSMHIWRGVRFTFLEHLGITLTDEDKKEFEGLTLIESLKYSNERFGIAENGDELFTLFFDYIRSRYLVDSCPKNDIIEFLEKLKAKGVKIGIATATAEYALKAVLEKYGMLGYFSVIRSTYTVGAAKTQPKVYDTVLDELGTDKETTWVFEDALYAAKTAKANGYNLVGIYDETEADTAVLEEISDIYIHNYAELEIE